MYDSFVEVDGVKLNVDPINRRRTDKSDNVMAIFQEEQPVMWQFTKPYVANAISQGEGTLDFLDVGTGSGIWSLLMRKHFPTASVLAIDKSPRAVTEAKKNAT